MTDRTPRLTARQVERVLISGMGSLSCRSAEVTASGDTWNVAGG